MTAGEARRAVLGGTGEEGSAGAKGGPSRPASVAVHQREPTSPFEEESVSLVVILHAAGEDGTETKTSVVTSVVAPVLSGPGGWTSDESVVTVGWHTMKEHARGLDVDLRIHENFGLPWDEGLDLVSSRARAGRLAPVRRWSELRGRMEEAVREAAGGLPEGWDSAAEEFIRRVAEMSRRTRVEARVRDLLRTAGAEEIAKALRDLVSHEVMSS